jgi:DNA invertase Pin-like site-specific DNA recombinase
LFGWRACGDKPQPHRQRVRRLDIDMVAAWSVDCLGRSFENLIKVLSDLHAKGVVLYLHQQGLDTSTPSGRAAPAQKLVYNRNVIGAQRHLMGQTRSNSGGA